MMIGHFDVRSGAAATTRSFPCSWETLLRAGHLPINTPGSLGCSTTRECATAAFTPDLKGPTPTETAFVDVKTAFRQLQADRHKADYDLSWKYREKWTPRPNSSIENGPTMQFVVVPATDTRRLGRGLDRNRGE
jgi:hypothetical protein